MPEQPIPFINKEASGFSELGGASPYAFNVLVDGAGAVRRRPGMRSRSGMLATAVASSAITGLWVSQAGDVYAVDDGAVRHIYKVSAAAANLTPEDPLLLGSGRPIFTETEAIIVVAGGARAMKVLLSDGTASLLADNSSPSDPPLATHIVANQSRLVANDSDNPNFLRFSDQAAGSSYAGHEKWLMAGVGTSGFVAADARPDKILALADNTNEVFVFGPNTLQVFAPDALSVYAPSATRQLGCAARYSVVAYDQSFMWLDDRRRFVMSDGRQFEVLSEPIGQTLQGLTTVSDCFGYRSREGWADVLVWTFPTEGLTFAYQHDTGGWSRWAGWDGNWTQFPVTAHCLSSNTNLVGLNDGRVGELGNAVLTDYDQPIRAYIATGYQTRGTDARKHCKCVRLAFKRGKTTGSVAPSARVGFRDRPEQSITWREISLGVSGDTEIVVPWRSLGVYRRRQWHFEFTGSDELVLAGAVEEFDVLGD